MDGWIGLSGCGCGKWKVESGLSGCGKWKVARFRISHKIGRYWLCRPDYQTLGLCHYQ